MQLTEAQHKKYRAALWSLIVIVVLFWAKVMWFNRPQLMSDDLGDAYRMYLPNLQFYFQAIARGEFPLWNPYELAGLPFVAVLEFGPYYPLTGLYAIFSLSNAHVISTGLHILILAVGCYKLNGTSLRLHPVAALLGALAMVVCGWSILRAPMFMDALRSMAYLPWVLLAADNIVRKPSALASAAFGMLLALQFLAGETEISVRTGFIIAPFVVFRLFVLRKELPNSLNRTARIGAALFAGGFYALGISAVQWIPTLEATAQSVRETGTLTFMQTQNGGHQTYSALANLLTTSSDLLNVYYVGVPVLLLALYSVRSRHPMWIFFAIMTAILASLSLGETSRLAQLYFNLPTGRWFRWPERYQPLLAFSISTLAAIATDKLIRDFSSPYSALGRNRWSRWTAVIFPTYALLFVIAWDFYQPSFENGMLIVPILFIVMLTAGVILTNMQFRAQWITPLTLIAFIILVPAFRYPARIMNPPKQLDLIGVPDIIIEHPGLNSTNLSRRYVDYATPDGRRVPKFGTLTNAPTLNGFSVFMPYTFWTTIKGYQIERLQTYDHIDNPNVPTGLWAGLAIDQGAQSALDVMGVTHVILGLGQELIDEEHPKTSLRKVESTPFYSLWVNDTAWARAFIVPNVRGVGTIEALKIKYDNGITPVTLENMTLNTVTLKLPENAPSGLLVLTDQDYPGWHVLVDGVERPLQNVAEVFRGVLINGTEKEVMFYYRPRSFILGAVITAISLLVWIAAILAVGRAEKRESLETH